MPTSSPGPSSSSRWTPFIFGGIFLLAAVLIFTGVMSHSSDSPADPGSGDVPATNAPAAP